MLLSFLFGFVTFTAASATVIDLGKCLSAQVTAYHQKAIKERDLNSCVKVIDALVPGDQVLFSDGVTFQLERKLGHGGSAYIWAIAGQPTRALRIPKGRGYDITYMDWYKKGWRRLKALGVPVIEIENPDRANLEYQVVERVDFNQKFSSFRNQVRRHRSLLFYESVSQHTKLHQAVEALKVFALKTAHIAEISEGVQAVYDGKSWRMFDFGKENITVDEAPDSGKASSETIWEDYIESPDGFFTQMHQMVLKYRQATCPPLLTD